MHEYHLNISCPDKPGIIATCTSFLSNLDVNIVDLKQHSSHDINTFFLRAHFESAKTINKAEFSSEFTSVASEFEMKWDLHSLDRLHRVGVMVSKTSHCLYELLLKNQDGELKCEIPCIVSNHKDLEPVAKHFNIPFYHVPSTISKAEQEVEFEKIAQRHLLDTWVMARYMQILREEFTSKWPGQIINIHHGFLPAFKGAKPYHQAWNKGVKIIGATAHYATQDLDQGPIISQDVISVEDEASIAEFVEMGKDIERRVLLKAIKLHIEHKIFIREGRTFLIG
jgi:formyltetrahydrofolate deformylase